jgi:hypothetical protein
MQQLFKKMGRMTTPSNTLKNLCRVVGSANPVERIEYREAAVVHIGTRHPGRTRAGRQGPAGAVLPAQEAARQRIVGRYAELFLGA